MQTIFINGGILRRLYPNDLAQFEAHLIRLDPESRHDRFAAAVSNDFIHRYAEGFFKSDDVAYGFFVDDVLRGAGELRQIGTGETRDAEAAFSVERAWRRGGVGTTLMARIVRAARNRSDETLTMMCLAHNQAMQHLASKFSAQLTFETDQVTGRMVSRRLSPLSLWHEMADDAIGLASSMMEGGHSANAASKSGA